MLQNGIASSALLMASMLWNHHIAAPSTSRNEPAKLLLQIKYEVQAWARAGAVGLCIVLPFDWDVH
jgi:hypothetical protein